jgi:hypothetical protein
MMQFHQSTSPKGRASEATGKQPKISDESTLAGLETALHLVDHVNPALAANQTVVAVTTAQRFQRVTDFHGTILAF